MSLPFSAEAFLDVFAQYNRALWPIASGLWLAAAAALVALVRSPGGRVDRASALLLVALWAWGGAVYHAAYFSSINPVAWGFALLFLLQSGFLAWYGLVRHELGFGMAPNPARMLGIALALYALAYPGLNILFGHRYPATPTFGVPCPTTLFTVGLLVMCRRPPLLVMVIPLLWSLIGGSAAVFLGVIADYMLLACAPLLIARALIGREPSR